MSGEGTLRYEVKVHEEKDDHLLKTQAEYEAENAGKAEGKEVQKKSDEIEKADKKAVDDKIAGKDKKPAADTDADAKAKIVKGLKKAEAAIAADEKLAKAAAPAAAAAPA